ncbi:ribonuclease activity regulator protein RraA [Vibrio navarrensis]|jgi:regulator of ribonuclease activity A|uniref:4-hydroxy-4-methyl-2-oxoglutarate aldolase n=1 Tax=Vibrio navarrensis TaxID=29495 RepID=A0A099LSI3_9VIBR|nr:putative 4-hydroxy-4-methyl-2-oxoglutarate aldolase [Vibrio navarrensis]EHA1125712.1 putative 4-hydroxy-4-methyl-2-oxoglutarate aldolase [Vibrio navarrensis]EJK2116736.1 putative 4-hydroxy-4-methyl-2-oxoglutarate aldolase [Vibrio navarrensis]EJL6395368.1 putative 4-hydroxy-4-methyl-2-oxoglutarate aldolase [Vibrio navarrensis]EKA5634721.1 putative 4-hydroxy-4-methyl-2-oxoglutarate aldolase [Vibrio navarrensis]ELN6933229.1 putative 4-hydroxy-4-methyl-2-oxoglutarate aldolase [Vibrio navarrensi
MNDITPDICDKFEDKVRLLNLPLQNYGQKTAFFGEIVTVRCYHDNSKVREMLSQDGKGKVLVVDGHGSCQKALLGDQLAILAIENNWEGVIVFGAVRDVAQMAQMSLGVKALGASPFKTEKRGAGEVNVTLMMLNQIVQPKEYIYADWNGILISKQALEI